MDLCMKIPNQRYLHYFFFFSVFMISSLWCLSAFPWVFFSRSNALCDFLFFFPVVLSGAQASRICCVPSHLCSETGERKISPQAAIQKFWMLYLCFCLFFFLSRKEPWAESLLDRIGLRWEEGSSGWEHISPSLHLCPYQPPDIEHAGSHQHSVTGETGAASLECVMYVPILYLSRKKTIFEVFSCSFCAKLRVRSVVSICMTVQTSSLFSVLSNPSCKQLPQKSECWMYI